MPPGAQGRSEIDDHDRSRPEQNDKGIERGRGLTVVGEQDQGADGSADDLSRDRGIDPAGPAHCLWHVAAQGHRITELSGGKDEAIEAADSRDSNGQRRKCRRAAAEARHQGICKGRRRGRDHIGRKQHLDRGPGEEIEQDGEGYAADQGAGQGALRIANLADRRGRGLEAGESEERQRRSRGQVSEADGDWGERLKRSAGGAALSEDPDHGQGEDFDEDGHDRETARRADAQSVDRGQDHEPADRHCDDIVGPHQRRRDERHGRGGGDRHRGLGRCVRRPEAPGDEEARGRTEFLFDVGLDALAAELRQAAHAKCDADYADTADHPREERIRAERGERDRKHENARSDDRPDHQSGCHPDSDRLCPIL